jgi:small subunit ribosomal protein S15
MVLTKRKKTNTMKKTRRHDDDTGSPEAQIALLTRRINELSDHLKDNPKDKGSRKGLLSMVEKRRKQINYLLDNDPQAYKQVAEKFDLKSLEDRQEQAKAEIGEDEQEE